MKNDRFQQYIHKFNRRVTGPEISSVAGVDHNLYQFTEFYRDSRQAFGVRFQVEKRTYEWLWCAAGIFCGVVSVVFMLGQL